MKHVASLGSFLLFASLAAPAQNPGAPGLNPASPAPDTHAQIVTLPPVQSNSACPVAMRARHDFFFQKELTTGAKPNERGYEPYAAATTQLRLTLTDFNHRRIQTANVTVRGTNGVGRLVPVDAGKPSPNVTRTMNLSFEPGDDSGVDAYLALRGFTTVNAIVLNSLTYADGSTWKTIDAGACQVAPDGFMLVR
ncbi:MAG TPA: hypothetical protein VL967_13105 [Terracidiphilus sp.]|nr:hypothetical protein [Terracidiphilus sp.]